MIPGHDPAERRMSDIRMKNMRNERESVCKLYAVIQPVSLQKGVYQVGRLVRVYCPTNTAYNEANGL